MTEIDGSLLDVNLEDQQDIEILPNDTEVELRVKRAEKTERRNAPGRYNLALVLEDPGNPLIEDIRTWVSIPCNADRDEDIKRYSKSVSRWKDMLRAFGMSETPNNVDDFIGATATVIVGVQSDPQYGVLNTIRRWVSDAR